MTAPHFPIVTEQRPTAPGSLLPSLLWRLGRWFAFVSTLLLLAGLFYRPQLALAILWGLLIPILPLSFFVSSQWWRGICPLATTNQWFGGRLRKTRLSGRRLALANSVGILLLVLMVPARHLVFNVHGPLLAFTIGAIIVAAALLGSQFEARAGFCNSICPVLPVERLYGQHPLLRIDNYRCHPCTHCIGKGCLEVDQVKSIQFAVRPPANSTNWLATAYGIFAASMPGFIVGYFSLQDIPWAELEFLPDAGKVYGWMAACSLCSYAIAFTLIRLSGMSARVSLVCLAATAGVLYYWWGAPLIVQTLQLPTIAEWPARMLFFLVIAYWFLRTLRTCSE